MNNERIRIDDILNNAKLIAFALVDTKIAIEEHIKEHKKLPTPDELNAIAKKRIDCYSLNGESFYTQLSEICSVKGNRVNYVFDIRINVDSSICSEVATQVKQLLPDAESVVATSHKMFIVYYNIYTHGPVDNKLPINLDLIDKVLSKYRSHDEDSVRSYLLANANVVSPLLDIARRLGVSKVYMPWLSVHDLNEFESPIKDHRMFMEFNLDLNEFDWQLMDEYITDKLLRPYAEELNGKLIISM